VGATRRNPKTVQWKPPSRAVERPSTVVGKMTSGGRSGVRLRMRGVNGSVLVVDDDPAFRQLARRVLAAFGLDVVGEAETAVSARTVADALRPDAVLVDVGLPDADGVAVARELTGLPWGPRVVLTSTDTDAAPPSEVRASGAEAFVPKSELLDAALDDLLGRRGP
jgi:DNA-binding NarL/FixJ family response regulator